MPPPSNRRVQTPEGFLPMTDRDYCIYRARQKEIEKALKETTISAKGSNKAKISAITKMTVKSTETVQTVDKPAKLTTDALIMQNITRNFQDNARDMERQMLQDREGGLSFRPLEYADRINDQLGDPSADDARAMTPSSWGKLAKIVLQTHRDNPLKKVKGFRVAPMTEMVFIDYREAEKPPAKPANRAASGPKRPLVPTNVRSGINSRSDKDSTKVALDIVCKTIRNALEESGKQTLNIFELCIDPRDFGRTVHNLFLVAQLIKNRRVAYIERLEEGDEESDDPCPQVYLVVGDQLSKARGDAGSQHETDHMCITLNMDQWKQLIEVLEIEEPMIKIKGAKASK